MFSHMIQKMVCLSYRGSESRLLSRHSRLELPLLVLSLGCLFFPRIAHGENWSTYRHDNRRSGVTSDTVLFPLDPLWVWKSPQPPRTAWSGPAKWDAYTGNRDLQSMRNFDPCFFVTADKDFVFFGSSSDDAAHALDAATGKEVWVNVAGAPVRLPPTIDGDRVLYGSDDGYVYCVNRRSGEQIWAVQGADDNRRIFNDRKLISLWPIRTGVMVHDGLATFGASLVPWEESHLITVQVATGQAESDGCFHRRLSAVTLQGALLASEKRLYAPQGRSAPLAFGKADGKPMGAVGEAGGVFCILTEDEVLLAGPNTQKEREHQIRMTSLGESKALASFAGTNRMLVSGKQAWFSVGGKLKQLDRSVFLESQKIISEASAAIPKGQKPSEQIVATINDAKALQTSAWQWSIPCAVPLEMIKAGDTLLLGFHGEVHAYACDSGELLWKQMINGSAYGIAVAHGRVFVSTDDGEIYAFGRKL